MNYYTATKINTYKSLCVILKNAFDKENIKTYYSNTSMIAHMQKVCMWPKTWMKYGN